MCLWKFNGLSNKIRHELTTLKESLIRCGVVDKIRSVVIRAPGRPGYIKDLADFKSLELVFVALEMYGWKANYNEHFYFRVTGPHTYAMGLSVWENLGRDLVSIKEYRRLIQGVIARGPEKVVPKVIFVDMFSKAVVPWAIATKRSIEDLRI